MGDANALARELVRLGADAVLRQRLGASACRRAADFTADRIAPRVMAVYGRVVSAQSTFRFTDRTEDMGNGC